MVWRWGFKETPKRVVSGQGACKCRITVREEAVGFHREACFDGSLRHGPVVTVLVTGRVRARILLCYGTEYVRVYIAPVVKSLIMALDGNLNFCFFFLQPLVCAQHGGPEPLISSHFMLGTSVVMFTVNSYKY